MARHVGIGSGVWTKTPLLASSGRVSGWSGGQGLVSAITPREPSLERTFHETRFPGREDGFEGSAELANAPTSVACTALASYLDTVPSTVIFSEKSWKEICGRSGQGIGVLIDV